MKIKTLAAAATFAVAGSMAGATTVALTSDTATGLGSIPGQDFLVELGNAGVDTLFAGNTSLIVNEVVTVTFSLVAAESNFENSLLFGGSEVITETVGMAGLADFSTGALLGESFSTVFAGGDLASLLSFEAIDFGGPTTLSFDASDDEFGVFAAADDIANLSTFFLALDDNGADIDDNHDDIIIRVDVAPVPLPASAFLLLAGLGGVFGMRRFRRDV